MTINKINEIDETKSETEKSLKKVNKMRESPQITQQEKDNLTSMRNKCLALIIECVFTKYYLNQEVEVLEKKYNKQ